MKSQDTAGAVDDLARVAPPGVAVACAQNGVANERMALRSFADVYGIAVMLPATHLRPGVVDVSVDTGQRAARHRPVPGRARRAPPRRWRPPSRAPRSTRWPGPTSCGGSTASSIMNLGNAVDAVVGAPGRSAPPADRAVGRGRGGARRRPASTGRSTDEDMARRGDLLRMHAIDGERREGGSSWQSLARGAGTIETDYLNGEIVLLGRLHGVATPVNELFQRLAGEAAAGARPPGRLSADEVLALPSPSRGIARSGRRDVGQPALEERPLGRRVDERRARRGTVGRLAGRPSRRSRSARVAGRWWARARRGSAATASTTARPAAGPSANATATARFSSTTGDGARRASTRVQRGDALPVGGRPRRGAGVHCGDGRLHAVRARRPDAPRPSQLGLALGDAAPVPAGPVLVLQQHDLALGAEPGGPAAVLQQHQGEQAARLGLVGQQRRPASRASRTPSSHSSSADQVVAPAGRVALGEHEVHAGQHRRQPLGQQVAGRHPERDVGGADLGLGPAQALGDRRLGLQEGAGDLAGPQPAHESQRQATWAAGGERGVAAREHHPQLVVVHRATSSSGRAADVARGRLGSPASPGPSATAVARPASLAAGAAAPRAAPGRAPGCGPWW